MTFSSREPWQFSNPADNPAELDLNVTRPAHLGKFPLRGKRIAVTRTRAQAAALRDRLAVLGAQVIEIPTIEIQDPASWEALDSALRRLQEFDILLAMSVNGVRNFFRRLKACGRGPSDLDRLTIGAIGPATAAEFRRNHVHVDVVPRRYVAENLLDALGTEAVRGKKILIPRAKVARDVVPRLLTERGAYVEVVEAYETVLPDLAPAELHRLLTPPPDVITFTSSSTATHFARLAGEVPPAQVLQGVVVASIGPITSHTARELGLTVTIEAEESTVPGLVRAIEEYFRSATA